MKFVLYNKTTRKITATGHCQPSAFDKQAGDGEFVLEGTANDVTQKVEFDGLDDNGQPINPRVVDKTSAEVERDNPKTKPKPAKKQRAKITNEQLQNILDRLTALELRGGSS